MVVVTRNVKSEDFVDSIGINIKTSYLHSTYANVNKVISSLDYIGVDKVRDALAFYPLAESAVSALANAGIDFNVRVPSTLPAQGAAGMAAFIQQLKEFKAAHPNSIVSIESLNEPNYYYFSYNGDSSFTGAVEFQKYLYNQLNAQESLKNIEIINFGLAFNYDYLYDQIPNVGAYSDAANAHLYLNTSDKNRDERMEHVFDLVKSVSVGDPVVITEMGHPTYPTEPGIGVSNKAQAKTTITELLLAYENGSEATYIYELFDSNPPNPPKEMQRHFGIFNQDGTPKLAATALHNLTTILTRGDDGSADGVLPTSFTIPGGGAKVHAMSLEKSGGVYDIAVWNDLLVWNDATNSDITNPVVSTQVNLGRVESVVKVYDPMTGTNPIATYNNVSSVTIPLRDSPLIIEVQSGTSSTSGTSGTSGTGSTTATAGADTLQGGTGNDTINGLGGADRILGGAGNDRLIGGSGNDTLLGQGGADRLIGGAGADFLNGGAGRDIFDFNLLSESNPQSRDTIVGFEAAGAAAGDRIDVSGIDARTGGTNDTFQFGTATGIGRLWAANSGTDTIIFGNTDADAAAEFAVRIQDGATTASAYTAADFIL